MLPAALKKAPRLLLQPSDLSKAARPATGSRQSISYPWPTPTGSPHTCKSVPVHKRTDTLVETNDTSAAADAGQRETAITTAHPSTTTVETDNTSATEKRTKNTHFSPAKAMTVSTTHGHEQAKATPVPDNRAPGLRDPAAPPVGTYAPSPQKTRMQFDWVKFQ